VSQRREHDEPGEDNAGAAYNDSSGGVPEVGSDRPGAIISLRLRAGMTVHCTSSQRQRCDEAHHPQATHTHFLHRYGSRKQAVIAHWRERPAGMLMPDSSSQWRRLSSSHRIDWGIGYHLGGDAKYGHWP
jgi:hypothetical protein